jgi:hypothetical protein
LLPIEPPVIGTFPMWLAAPGLPSGTWMTSMALQTARPPPDELLL